MTMKSYSGPLVGAVVPGGGVTPAWKKSRVATDMPPHKPLAASPMGTRTGPTFTYVVVPGGNEFGKWNADRLGRNPATLGIAPPQSVGLGWFPGAPRVQRECGRGTPSGLQRTQIGERDIAGYNCSITRNRGRPLPVTTVPAIPREPRWPARHVGGCC